MGSKAKAAVPILLKFYQSSDDDVTRILIVQALGKIGPDAMRGIPLLSPALQSTNDDLRRAAAEAIEAITKARPEK